MQPWPEFEVMIDAESIRARVRELAEEIAAGFSERQVEPLVVAVWEGAKPFARDLTARLPGQPTVHGIRASSYGAGTTSSGKVRVEGGDTFEPEGRDVLLIEDIVDTGRTIAALRTWFRARGAQRVEVVSLLDKPSRRVPEGEAADFIGFPIEDRFVIGYGMDVAGRWRELPHVAVWNEALDPHS